MSSLKARTVSGVKWQMVNKIAQKVISVGTFAVLASFCIYRMTIT